MCVVITGDKIIPAGIAAFVMFCFSFLFAIRKWDLKPPGREDDQIGKGFDLVKAKAKINLDKVGSPFGK